MSEYHPISCGAYDEIEVLAMHRASVTLVCLRDEGTRTAIKGKICDTRTRDGAEFVILLSKGERRLVRLDRIFEIIDASGAPIWRQKTDGQAE